jgi:hypothetical protein
VFGAHGVRYQPGDRVWVGRSRGSEREGPSCAISVKAPTASLWLGRKEYGPSRRASFTRAEKTTKRAEVPNL